MQDNIYKFQNNLYTFEMEEIYSDFPPSNRGRQAGQATNTLSNPSN